MKAKFVFECLYEEDIRYSGKWPQGRRLETRLEKQKREAREFLHSEPSYLGTFKTIQDLIKADPQPNDWILRSADGEGSFILFNGDLASEERVNQLKTYYKTDQGLHYFAGRPIRYKHWINLPDKYKLAARRKKL